MRTFLLSVCVLACAVPAVAQDEAALRDFFEGKSVIVKIDMPGTQEGVDVAPDARRPMDMSRYSQRLKQFGVAIRAGDSVMITKIHVKDKLIEFQLGGGGYGTFGDDTSSVGYTPTPKSQREKDLERWIKDEHNSDRRHAMQRELDDLRARREREDARKQAAATVANEGKQERIADARLHSGSRFNIRYDEGVPPGLGPDGVMRALEDYVEFPFAGGAPAAAPMPPPPAPMSMSALHKGMSVADVEDILGKPDKTSARAEGTLRVTTAIYSKDDQRITAEFVEGVLIRYSISSK